MKQILLVFILCFSYLSAWEFHEYGSIPEEGTIILFTPHGYNLKCGMRLEFRLTRYSPLKPIERGYFTLTDEELLGLFKGEIPFSFIP